MQLEDKLENTHTITIFYDTMKMVVDNVDKQEILSDPDQLTASLLELENVDFEVAPNSNVAVKIYSSPRRHKIIKCHKISKNKENVIKCHKFGHFVIKIIKYLYHLLSFSFFFDIL